MLHANLERLVDHKAKLVMLLRTHLWSCGSGDAGMDALAHAHSDRLGMDAPANGRTGNIDSLV